MISAIVHTYNEEKNIERCLSSLSFVDEIVLIDMGSNDKTCSLASSFKAKIYTHPYTGFVEPARNFGISKAKGDWVLILDADEEVPKSLANYLLNEISKSPFDFYRISRKNIIFGKWVKHTGWWPDYQIRFFKKGAVSWTKKIHGIPLTRGKGTDIEAKEELSIVHHNYQGLDQFIERLNRYSSISAKELYLANRRFSIKDLFEIPTKEFINRYFVWEGYKDGLHGLALSLLQTFSELIGQLKLWELEGFKPQRIDLREIQYLLSQQYKQKQYWLTDVLIKRSQNFLDKLVLRLKRKFWFFFD